MGPNHFLRQSHGHCRPILWQCVHLSSITLHTKKAPITDEKKETDIIEQRFTSSGVNSLIFDVWKPIQFLSSVRFRQSAYKKLHETARKKHEISTRHYCCSNNDFYLLQCLRTRDQILFCLSIVFFSLLSFLYDVSTKQFGPTFGK